MNKLIIFFIINDEHDVSINKLIKDSLRIGRVNPIYLEIFIINRYVCYSIR